MRDRKYGGAGSANGYSKWHRSLHDDLTVIDIDWIEYCRYCRNPLALIETARDLGQPDKSADVLSRLGKLSGRVTWTVLYGTGIRMKQIEPDAGTGWQTMRRSEFAVKLEQLRTCHPCRDSGHHAQPEIVWSVLIGDTAEAGTFNA